MRGLFITFEGPDGAGKTTQIKMLEEYLLAKGKKVKLTREPGGTKISEGIRGLLLDANNKGMVDRTELLLYAASRAQHVDELIAPAVEEGQVVICDRFYDSTLAYQGYGRGIDISLIEQLNLIATKGINPDLTILLDIDVNKGLSRVQSQRGSALDRLEGEKIEFHEKVRAGFLILARENPQRIKVISADRSADEIFLDIINLITQAGKI